MLSTSEMRHSVFERELLAIFVGINHFHYLQGKQVTDYTDHKPLTTVLKFKTGTGRRQFTHSEFIVQFMIDIQYIRGEANIVADTFTSCLRS